MGKFLFLLLVAHHKYDKSYLSKLRQPSSQLQQKKIMDSLELVEDSTVDLDLSCPGQFAFKIFFYCAVPIFPLVFIPELGIANGNVTCQDKYNIIMCPVGV